MLTAGAPSHVLIERLERAGWGNLAGPEFKGVRFTLAALTRALDPRSGAGKATVWQIAERTGYTERWTRRCLQILEELELIEWHRGGISDGKPVPSWFRVSKTALLLLVSIARTKGAERRSEAQAATRDRIARYKLHRTKRHQQSRRSDHAELASRLLSIKEEPRARAPLESPQPAARATVSSTIAQIRADLLARRGAPTAPTHQTSAARTR